MLDLQAWTSLRWLHLREGKSQRWIANEFGISRNTVSKYIKNPDAPKYTMKEERAQPLREQWRAMVAEILEADETAPRKQKHTSRRIFDRLVAEHGYTGSLRTLQYLVTEWRQRKPAQVMLPLSFAPGKDAQVDFSESFIKLQGKKQKIFCFEMRLNYSRKKFQMAFLAANREAFLEGHVRAFEYFGGVPARLSYDNLKAAVVKILRGKQRHLTDSFKQLAGYYAFDHNFCTPYKANEKGGVENGVGYSRRNWLVPVPEVESVRDLNSYLRQKCDAEDARTVAGTDRTIGEAFEEERRQMLSLPDRHFLPITVVVARTDKYSTVKFQTNRYSVPPEHMGQKLLLKVSFDSVTVSDGRRNICQHDRSYRRCDFILKPEHYLDALERKPNAIPYTMAVTEYQWPCGYWQYFEKLKQAHGASEGGRQFLCILRAHTRYGAIVVGKSVQDALELHIYNADAVVNLVHRDLRLQQAPPPLDVSGYEKLLIANVQLPPADQYNDLLCPFGGLKICA